MIIKEYFYAGAECSEDTCSFIENNDCFNVYREYSIVNRSITKKDPSHYCITFTSTRGTFEQFIDDIYRHKEQMLPVMDDQVMVIYRYEDQCNLSFDPDLLKKISEMNLHLLVTCYCSDESE